MPFKVYLTDWYYIYNPKSDSWEIISNNTWSSKSGAEDFVKEIGNAEKLIKENQTLSNPDNFVEWQKKCVCDFVNNDNTHSKSCLERFKEQMRFYL